MVLTAACYWLSRHCILAQNSEVYVRAGVVHNRSRYVLDSNKCVCSHLSSPQSIYTNWIDSHSRVDECVTDGNWRIIHEVFEDELVLLASSE